MCGENALVVYPRLDSTLQQLWNEAVTDKRSGDLTEKVGSYIDFGCRCLAHQNFCSSFVNLYVCIFSVTFL